MSDMGDPVETYEAAVRLEKWAGLGDETIMHDGADRLLVPVSLINLMLNLIERK